MYKMLRIVGAVWGVVGVIALLLFAVYRLLPFVGELFDANFTVWQWVLVVLWSTFMIYTEGYKAFMQQFSPRVVARAQYLARQGSVKQLLLAPVFCTGYFNSTRKRVLVAYLLMAGIITLIAIVHFIPQPWRGIIDVGVVLGLLLGISSLFVFAILALLRPSNFVADPEVITNS